MKKGTSKQVAAIANKFIQHARYKLTPREQRLILYMATMIKPEDSGFETYMVPVTEIEDILKADDSKKHGSFYERLDNLLNSITDKKIAFPTDFTIDGVRLRGYINWVAGAVPKMNEDEVLCVEFGFSPQMKPFLLGLKEKFTQIEFMEVSQMKSGFSIRIFQMCKAYYFENKRHGRDTLKVGIKELKERLGIPDKYPDFRNFRRKVLDVARNEINEKTSLLIDFEFARKGRKISDVHIVIEEKSKLTAAGQTAFQEEINALTEAQYRALEHLLTYGLEYQAILPTLGTLLKAYETLKGYEDLFCYYLIEWYEANAKHKTASAKIKHLGILLFNQDYAKACLAFIAEKIAARKEMLSEEESTNRKTAQNMDWRAFRTYISNSKKKSIPKKGVFHFATFQKKHPEIVEQIRSERLEALHEAMPEGMKPTPAILRGLESNLAAYCEHWWRLKTH